MLLYTLDEPCFKNKRSWRDLFDPIWVNNTLFNDKLRTDLPSTPLMKFEHHFVAPDWSNALQFRSNQLVCFEITFLRPCDHTKLLVINASKLDCFETMLRDSFQPIWGFRFFPFHQILASIAEFVFFLVFFCLPCMYMRACIHRSKKQQICGRIGSRHYCCCTDIWYLDT